MKIEVRTARPEDAVSACSVLRRSIQECCIEDHRNETAILDAWLGNKTPETILAWMRCVSNYCIVAHVDGAMAGIAILTRQGKIALCYVAPEHRFGGTGKALLEALESHAKEWGLSSLQVASTITAKSFYARNGYIAGGTTRTPFGTEATLFSKRLSASYGQKKPCKCSAGQQSGEAVSTESR